MVWEQGTWTGSINVTDFENGRQRKLLLVAEKDGAALRIKAHTWSVNSTT